MTLRRVTSIPNIDEVNSVGDEGEGARVELDHSSKAWQWHDGTGDAGEDVHVLGARTGGRVSQVSFYIYALLIGRAVARA